MGRYISHGGHGMLEWLFYNRTNIKFYSIRNETLSYGTFLSLFANPEFLNPMFSFINHMDEFFGFKLYKIGLSNSFTDKLFEKKEYEFDLKDPFVSDFEIVFKSNNQDLIDSRYDILTFKFQIVNYVIKRRFSHERFRIRIEHPSITPFEKCSVPEQREREMTTCFGYIYKNINISEFIKWFDTHYSFDDNPEKFKQFLTEKIKTPNGEELKFSKSKITRELIYDWANSLFLDRIIKDQTTKFTFDPLDKTKTIHPLTLYNLIHCGDAKRRELFLLRDDIILRNNLPIKEINIKEEHTYYLISLLLKRPSSFGHYYIAEFKITFQLDKASMKRLPSSKTIRKAPEKYLGVVFPLYHKVECRLFTGNHRTVSLIGNAEYGADIDSILDYPNVSPLKLFDYNSPSGDSNCIELYKRHKKLKKECGNRYDYRNDVFVSYKSVESVIDELFDIMHFYHAGLYHDDFVNERKHEELTDHWCDGMSQTLIDILTDYAMRETNSL